MYVQLCIVHCTLNVQYGRIGVRSGADLLYLLGWILIEKELHSRRHNIQNGVHNLVSLQGLIHSKLYTINYL